LSCHELRRALLIGQRVVSRDIRQNGL